MTGSTIHAGGDRLSGAALAARGEQVAAGLAAMGVREGDVIAVLLRNGLPYLEIIQACKRLGCYYCPINWHFTAAEAAFLIEDSGARLLIANTVGLPEAFLLYEKSSGVLRPASIVWRQANAIGVEFTGPPTSINDPANKRYARLKFA